MFDKLKFKLGQAKNSICEFFDEMDEDTKFQLFTSLALSITGIALVGTYSAGLKKGINTGKDLGFTLGYMEGFEYAGACIDKDHEAGLVTYTMPDGTHVDLDSKSQYDQWMVYHNQAVKDVIESQKENINLVLKHTKPY